MPWTKLAVNVDTLEVVHFGAAMTCNEAALPTPDVDPEQWNVGWCRVGGEALLIDCIKYEIKNPRPEVDEDDYEPFYTMGEPRHFGIGGMIFNEPN